MRPAHVAACSQAGVDYTAGNPGYAPPTASADAAGTFVVNVSDWAQRDGFGQQSFLTAGDFGLITVESTTPALIVVPPASPESLR